MFYYFLKKSIQKTSRKLLEKRFLLFFDGKIFVSVFKVK
jgi:hypothetical protein